MSSTQVRSRFWFARAFYPKQLTLFPSGDATNSPPKEIWERGELICEKHVFSCYHFTFYRWKFLFECVLARTGDPLTKWKYMAFYISSWIFQIKSQSKNTSPFGFFQGHKVCFCFGSARLHFLATLKPSWALDSACKSLKFNIIFIKFKTTSEVCEYFRAKFHVEAAAF